MSRLPVFPRDLQRIIETNLKHFAFVSITGPRQSGKTTLCHLSVNSKYKYVNFESQQSAFAAANDPESFIKEFPHKVILDEVQKVPQLFSELMVHTDTAKKKGAYILTGSQNFLLMESISQSLAGRVAVFFLLPFSLHEVYPNLKAKEQQWQQLAVRGFYPALYAQRKISTQVFYRSYIATYLERDVRTLLNIRLRSTFRKFLKICAVRSGNIINLNEISNQLNVDATTIRSWLSILESSFIIYLIAPYHSNLDKRVYKKPKLYFYDTGLLSYLLGIRSAEQLNASVHKGSVFENFVITDMIKRKTNKGELPEFFYWQDTNGNEVDLIYENGDIIELYEIKSSETARMEHAAQLVRFSALAQARGLKTSQTVIYAGAQSSKVKQLQMRSWKDLAKLTW
ncbi:MAG: hypothetical protein RL660_1272 [Bacteroidota bacterium]|jgi:predicted AAA+ superfamily ATPase